jgi:Suppressor of fused protein (SUFU)
LSQISGDIRRGFVPARTVLVRARKVGPVNDNPPGFRVLAWEPLVTEPWTFLTCGASDAVKEERLEFFVLANLDYGEHVETLAMTANYRADPRIPRIDVGSLLELGKPWVHGSRLDSFLVSLPYLYGPPFEYMLLEGGEEIRLLWLIPISQRERPYAEEHGADALEERLEGANVNDLDPMRPD